MEEWMLVAIGIVVVLGGMIFGEMRPCGVTWMLIANLAPVFGLSLILGVTLQSCLR